MELLMFVALFVAHLLFGMALVGAILFTMVRIACHEEEAGK